MHDDTPDCDTPLGLDDRKQAVKDALERQEVLDVGVRVRQGLHEEQGLVPDQLTLVVKRDEELGEGAGSGEELGLEGLRAHGEELGEELEGEEAEVEVGRLEEGDELGERVPSGEDGVAVRHGGVAEDPERLNCRRRYLLAHLKRPHEQAHRARADLLVPVPAEPLEPEHGTENCLWRVGALEHGTQLVDRVGRGLGRRPQRIVAPSEIVHGKGRINLAPLRLHQAMALEWPPLHRSTPRLVPLSAQLILLDHFLSPPALAVWAAFLQHHVVPRLLPSPPRQPGNAIRTNDRFSIDDPALAMSLWTATGLDRIVCAERRFDVRLASPVGLNSNIRLYRYQKGAVFGSGSRPLRDRR